jgi:hypothetical protein
VRTVASHLYYDAVADCIADTLGMSMNLAYQLAKKYQLIIARDNREDVPIEDCVKNIKNEWLKPQTINYVSPLKSNACIGINKVKEA